MHSDVMRPPMSLQQLFDLMPAGGTVLSAGGTAGAGAALTPLMRPISCAWFMLGSAAMVEIGLTAHPDCIVLDRQHGLWERTALEAAVGIARHRVPVVVRVADYTPGAISEALDAGACSVLVPMVETIEQAEAAVRASRYPPVGTRSAGGVRPLLGGTRMMRDDGVWSSVGAMIETRYGVENVEAIAAVSGLGYLFIGTGDLAMSHGDYRDLDQGDRPELQSRVEADCLRVLRAAHAHGKPCGIFTTRLDDAVAKWRAGFDWVVACSDIDAARKGMSQACAAMQDARDATDAAGALR
ncbi:2-dehydro-3-deoxyglucarate aldolase/4-hydroxy-2-oxoheptanedioate aldolase [Robbsia andropogonis]|uniref:HpcH/HpaI aldolase family protein n=1 Tax=Robbsia andropogonis TaxID=28092 RepID=UPI00209F318D|nr:aldolase/citrate lyase family protein [Robbsia andropogonis]MCP1116872.1 aldolase/citrate lyase family protein [Robbsia andropogonis]MCP1126449.1 aldolase/citrate lyase family protein [Robbsia andropogonis]